MNNPPVVEPVSPQVIVSPPQQDLPARWNLATRIVFRFCSVYFSLYVATSQMLWGLFGLQLPQMLNLTSWFATHLFGVTRALVITGSGSGDKTFDWVHAFCLLMIALAATAVWSFLDRARDHYVSLHKWFHLFFRFALGSTMVTYGMTKAIPLQMPEPSLMRLLEAFGNFSPMGVLWSSIGASRGYEIFTGCAELAGGILLFVPRTATLGALICLVDAIEIFTLNMTYDVPVKLLSFHMVLMSLVLLAPEASRLANVLVLNRTAGPSTLPPLLRDRRANWIMVAAQVVFGAYLVGRSLQSAAQAWTKYGEGAPKSPLYGIWNVDEMIVDGNISSPFATDFDRWRRVVFQTPTGMSFQRRDDTFVYHGVTIDAGGKTLTLTKGNDKTWTARFSYQRPAADRLILDGDMDGHRMHMELQLFDRNKFMLVSRGFHWIQEYPFNR